MESADSEQNTENPSTTTSLPPRISPGAENRYEARPVPGVGGGGTLPGFMGKHRMVAAIAYLDQQIQILQEEIEQLDTLGESSVVCKEVIGSIESIPDALLPVTKAPPVDVGWDRWFQGGHASSRKNNKRWM